MNKVNNQHPHQFRDIQIKINMKVKSNYHHLEYLKTFVLQIQEIKYEMAFQKPTSPFTPLKGDLP